MKKNPEQIRDRQICLYFSETEKEQFDNLCDYYQLSRPDFVRVAMYIAEHSVHAFSEACLITYEKGILTRSKSRR